MISILSREIGNSIIWKKNLERRGKKGIKIRVDSAFAKSFQRINSYVFYDPIICRY